ncbi:DNA-deoxyinosine glycosylase [Mycoplasmatota bacterium]|nr:DNA-deoxyinosine glycosylase [Mycoplasmatota bacterium]
MKETLVNHQFGPIYDKLSKILILGSFPSVKSRENDFYYMHPNNRFWKLLSMIYEDEGFLDEDIQKKKHLLKKYHIALYDVIEKCSIHGSSDSTIKNIKVSDIENILNNSSIKKIFLNGRKAESIFHTYYPNLKYQASYLPSTSPANARFSLDDLYIRWKDIYK